MRFELAVALKYLIPKWRQLSVSIISLVSVLVISLVVWLVLVFLSVTDGIEKKWIEELVALNAPVRLSPTEAYYESYYYQIDKLSGDSNYSLKTIGEKLVASDSDPYNPQFDMELPIDFPQPDRFDEGGLKDPVKEAFAAITSLPFSGIRPKDYEVGLGNVRIEMQRGLEREEGQRLFLTQLSYIASFDEQNKQIARMVLDQGNHDPNEPWIHSCPDGSCAFPSDNSAILGEPLLVSKQFQKNGVQLGDKGTLSYYAEGGSSMQEMRLAIYIAGFYDPGMVPVGNKLIFARPETTTLLQSSTPINDPLLGNGVNVWIDELSEAIAVKEALIEALKERGVDRYWTVQSYQDYEFTRPIIDQLQSDRTLFTLIAIIILIVACSNIISMLILLVNDKKKQIGILQSMGASPLSIASIFGLCGFITGLVSSIVGMGAALLTLHNLDGLVSFLSFLQGREAFQQAFYGSSLPNEISYSALTLVFGATLLISLLAGIVPAIKAARINPTDTLRTQ